MAKLQLDEANEDLEEARNGDNGKQDTKEDGDGAEESKSKMRSDEYGIYFPVWSNDD